MRAIGVNTCKVGVKRCEVGVKRCEVGGGGFGVAIH